MIVQRVMGTFQTCHGKPVVVIDQGIVGEAVQKIDKYRTLFDFAHFSLYPLYILFYV